MLASAQQQIERHFAELATVRKPFGFPVYALEHGLTADEISSLAQAASDDLQRYGVRNEIWLVWVVLAAEAGYRYGGEEFWSELEIVPHEWRNNQNRTWLRHRFKRFSERFAGPVPVGRWARHFSIIAWPIANAILPRYLQAHFAEHLFAHSYSLAELSSSNDDQIGRFLSEHYSGSSTRFSDFLQQTHLTTTIIVALREEEETDAPAPRIVPAVLQRIVDDLEKRRTSKDYLRAARKVINTRRASVSAALGGQEPHQTTGASGSQAITGARLVARRMAERSLLIGAMFPDTAAALSKAGLATTRLTSATIRLAGADARPEPALSLLTFSRRDRELSTFPRVGEPIAKLEGADLETSGVLDPLLQLREHESWVLRRYADGLYREVLGGHVRPGHAYVVVSRTGWPTDATEAAGLTPLIARTSGVTAYALELGSTLSEDQRLALAKLKIGAVTGSRVEPLGLAPLYRSTDRPTWLANEAVTLRIIADFDVAGFSVQLDQGPPEVLPTDGTELLLELGPLSLGVHKLRVQALEHAQEARRGVTEAAEYEFAVAVPRPWPETMREKAGFRLIVEPSGATLEHLFSRRARLRILGPVGRTVHWSLETFDASGHRFVSGPGGDTVVGGKAANVAAVLDRLRQSNSDAIDIAHRIDVVASMGELGRQAIAFPHKVDPLRWHYDVSEEKVRLIDETAHNSPVKIRIYPLSQPVSPQSVDYESAIAGIRVPSPGLLAAVIFERRIYSMFISAPARTKLNRLQDLGLRQALETEKSDRDAVLMFLASLRRWERARPVGPQALLRKLITIEKIENEMGERLCGHDFMRTIIERNERSFHQAQRMVGGSPGFGVKMRSFPITYTKEEALAAFIYSAKLYSISGDEDQCRTAFEIAFNPSKLRTGGGDDARKLIDHILANRTLLRGAFLARATTRYAELNAELEAC